MSCPAEHTDRVEIETALRTYAVALDERRFELWNEVFTEDAVIDFSPMGGRRETPAQMSARLGATDPGWVFAQHPLYNTVIEVDGDTASAHSEYGVETGRWAGDPADRILVRMSGGGSYRDTLRRTESGWRITERVISMKWKRTETVADEVATRSGSLLAQRGFAGPRRKSES
ncbi:nuclear transport factor 2 family protein [Gordonia terrae]|uniref:nuclear transport factor 2 family protein n=1 Tax=Gordonia terrae TaxID=2055 RepID=UPI003F6C8DB9